MKGAQKAAMGFSLLDREIFIESRCARLQAPSPADFARQGIEERRLWFDPRAQARGKCAEIDLGLAAETHVLKQTLSPSDSRGAARERRL